MGVRSYRDLIVWQKSMDLIEMIYGATIRFPSNETFGLTAQVRRAAVSIASNIAEGQGRRTTRDFLQFLGVARGSLQEVQTQIEISRRLGHIELADHDRISSLADEVARLLNGLCRSLGDNPDRGAPGPVLSDRPAGDDD